MQSLTLKTFIIYARADGHFKDALRRQLKPLEQLRLLDVWDDSHLLPGEEWEKSIEQKLDESHLILMLVSEASLFSDFIQKKELKTALERKRQGITQFIPILVRDCLWDVLPDFKTVQMLPLDEKRSILAVEAWISQSSAWAAALRELHRLIPDIQQKIASEIAARETAQRAEAEARKQQEETEKTEKLRHKRDEAAWKKVLAEVAATGSVEEKSEIYRTYLEDHSNHRDEAEASMHELQAEEELARKLKEKRERLEQQRREEEQRRKEEDADHAAFAAARTRADFEAYLKKYSLHAREARRKAGAFKKEEAAEKARLRAKQERREAAERAQREAAARQQNLPEMVLIKGGTFDMGDTFGDGSDREKPVHKVTVGDFYLGKYAVTVAQFKAFIGDTGYKTDADKDGGSYIWDEKKGEWVKTAGINWRCDVNGKVRPESDYNHPVIHVSWNDAKACANWYSEKTGQQFRLPSEAEWEYAAREGGKKVRFGNGKDVANPSEINFNGSKDYKQPYSLAGEYRRKTVPVDSFQPNALGLYQMSGNVWEWCEDWYHDSYKNAPSDGSAWLSPAGSYRVLRGGSWSGNPQSARAACRGSGAPASRNGYAGFRLARTK